VPFGQVALGFVGTQERNVDVVSGNPIVSIEIRDSNKSISTVFKSFTSKEKEDPCHPAASPEKSKGGSCKIGIGFMPSDDHSSVTATLTVTFWDGTSQVGGYL